VAGVPTAAGRIGCRAEASVAGEILTGATEPVAPALGGVQIGTAYLLCPEAIPKSCACAALKSAASRRTALIHLFTGDLRVAL
jgi:NAD(P)H-dependent flavin oxidoreductase YrpB (nitropropane dioxygenase family)